jgi:hypothetical protein
VLHSLRQEVIEIGLPGFVEIVEIVVRHLASPAPADYYSIDDELRALTARYPWSDTTPLLCESAKRCISGGRAVPAQCETSEDRSVQVGVSILSGLAVSIVSTTAVVNELRRRGLLPIGSLESRRAALYSRLCAREELTTMAHRMLARSGKSTAPIRRVRVRRPKVSQHQLLTMPIG